MYPWYRQSVSQYCNNTMPAIKTESGFNDCMLALDYAAQTKKATYVWSQDQNFHGTGTGTSKGQHVSHGPPPNPSQGLVHWMSVMAEHMNSANHENPVHYMWNNVEQCGGHVKEIEYWPRQNPAPKQGYESKTNETIPPQNTQKEILDDAGNIGYQSNGNNVRSNSSSNSSSPTFNQSAMLIVPQPINASSKGTTNNSGGGSGGSRKYNCKMCPQCNTFLCRKVESKKKMSEMQAGEYHRENGLNLRENGINLRENGLHLRENGLHLRENGLLREEELRESNHIENSLKLRLTNGHGNYDIAKLTSNRHPVPNGYKHEYMGNSEDVKHYEASNPPSPSVDPQNSPDPERKVFGSKADLQLHTQIHMREAKPYKCTQCSKAFANSSYLSQHTRIHLGIKPYRCEICQRKFTQLSHLQQHIRTHTGDKPYRCKFNSCSKAFSQLSNLQSHSRCHQQDKPFKCNSCYKCFVDENSLLEHIPKHRESKHLKTHICPYCGKSYTQETYLTKHMSKHSERTDKRSPILGIGLNRINQPEYWKNSETLVEAIANHDRLAISQENLQNLQHFSSLGEHHLAGLNKQNELRDSPDLRTPLADTIQRSPTIKPNDINKNYEEELLRSGMPSDIPNYEVKNNLSNSAFTPINQINYNARPYLPYDTISFQNKGLHLDLNKTNGNNCVSFPNNLISLHQIRNYAHQPTSSVINDHGVPSLKDK